MYTRKMLHKSTLDQRAELFSLAKIIFSLLFFINQENFPNSIYTMQWYSFFKMLILSDEISKDIRVDHMLINLFAVTELNVSYQSDLRQVVSKIRFEQYNISAMRLLLAFCSYSQHRDPYDQEDLIQQLMDEENKQNIFRPLSLDDRQKVSLSVSETKKVKLKRIYNIIF